MSISRRKFLKAGSMIALSAGVPLRSILAAGQQARKNNAIGGSIDSLSSEMVSDSLFYYDQATFTAYLNSTFRLDAGNQGILALTLIRVTDLMPSRLNPSPGLSEEECFALNFEASSGISLPQGTYPVDHDALGSFRLFLVPGGPVKSGGQRYVAIINRLAHNPTTIPVSNRSGKRTRTGIVRPAQATTSAQPTTSTTITKPAKVSTRSDGFRGIFSDNE